MEMKKKRSPSSDSISSSAHSSSQCIPKINKKRKTKVQNDTARRTPTYRGVSMHRLTGRFEAHLWDRGAVDNRQNKKKGRQVYLGAFDNEEVAARTYDLAALKYWGSATKLNFPVGIYQKEIEEMQNLTNKEYLAFLRRKSTGFSRGVSKYRGVARHHGNGRWEARIGRVYGNKYLYLGTYSTQEEAAVAYDMAAIQHRGLSAVTNFDISRYTCMLKQDHPQEHNTPAQTSDDQQNDEQNHTKDERGKQDQEMNLLPQALECLNNTDLHKDGVMNYANEYEYEDEQSWSLCWDVEKCSKLNVSDDVPHEKPGELASLFKEIDNGLEDYIDLKYDGLSPVENELDNIDMFFNESFYEKYEFNQDGIVDDEFMQMAAMDQNYEVNREMVPEGKEYCASDEVSNLVEKEEKTNRKVISLSDGKGCSSDEASDLEEKEEKRNKNAASPSSSTASVQCMF